MERGETCSLATRSSLGHWLLVSLIISLCSISVITAVPIARAVVSAGGEENADSMLELYPEPFFPEGTYDSSIPDPESFLGYPLGTKPIHHRQAIDYFKALASFSPTIWW